MKWIPASHHPKEGETVLAFWKCYNNKVKPDCYGVTTYRSGTWWSVDDVDYDYGDPMFWMELPKAPNLTKEKQSEVE